MRLVIQLFVVWVHIIIKAECIFLRQLRTSGYKISNCLLIPNEFIALHFFQVKKGLLFELFVLSFLVSQIAHKNILTSIFKLPFWFKKNVVTKRWKNYVQSCREKIQFHGVPYLEKYAHKGTKVAIHVKVDVHKTWFSHWFECPLLRYIMGFAKGVRGQSSDIILSIAQLEIKQHEKPFKVLCSIDMTHLIMLDLLSKFEKKIIVFWVYLFLHEPFFFAPNFMM